uniref:Tyrosinase n=1 Tax=Pinctada fucata TaxID=50426 RepID=Q287T6_PINFU|nr:tyrosinase [Pinctada fucata]
MKMNLSNREVVIFLLLAACTSAALLGDKYNVPPECMEEVIFDYDSPKDNSTLNKDCVKFVSDSYRKLQQLINGTDDDINYIRSLTREGMALLYPGSGREKRQAALRARRECRSLTSEEWRRLANAIRRLKFDPGNRFDTMARIHAMPAVIANAHDGSSILGWHRVFLYLFENALRRKVPGVVLCYWDSTIDYLIPGPGQAQSSSFSHNMFGNSRGLVRTGPFANFPTPWGPLRRNFGGEGGSLMRPHVVDMIASDPRIRSHGQIVDGQGATGFIDSMTGQRTSLEAEHNNAHVAVGALMAVIPNAAWDPLFYFHHCYIDYVWQLFRRKLRNRLGIDPARDYLGHGGPAHAPNAPLLGLIPGWRNVHGYSNVFTQRVYRYHFHPVCGNGCSGSTRRLLYCPGGGSRYRRCVSNTMPGRAQPPALSIAGRSAEEKFKTVYDDPDIAS